VTFRVPGLPIPQGSKSHVGRGILVESADRKTKRRPAGELKRWRKSITLLAKFAHKGPLLDGPLHVYLNFALPKPKRPKFKDYPATKPDIDKLSRAVLDALSDSVYTDDARVCQLSAIKKWADPDVGPGVAVTVMEMT